MSKKFFKALTSSISLAILSLVMALGIGFVSAQVWQEPTATPPGDNVAAPINVSVTNQAKKGSLTVGSDIINPSGITGFASGIGAGGTFVGDPLWTTYGLIGWNIGNYGGLFVGNGFFSGDLYVGGTGGINTNNICHKIGTTWYSCPPAGGAVNCSDCNDTFVNENQDNSITTNMLFGNSVTNIKMANNSVNTTNIINDTILWEDFSTTLQTFLSGSGAAPQDLYGVLTETFHTGGGSDAREFLDQTFFGGDVIVYNDGGVRIYGSMSSPEGTSYGLDVRGSGDGKGDVRINNDLRVGGMITNRQPGYGPGDRVGEVILDVLDANTIVGREEISIVGGWIHGGTTERGTLSVNTLDSGTVIGDVSCCGCGMTGTCAGVCCKHETSPGSGVCTCGSFTQPDSTNPERQISYVDLESGDDRVFFDGVAQLTDGKAVIKVPEHFKLVASEITPLNVSLTPFGPANTLYAASRSLEEIVVREKDGNANIEFGYLVITDRAGTEETEAIQENTRFKPGPGETLEEFAKKQWGIDQKLLIQNGILNPDGTANKELIDKLGWEYKE